MEEQREGRDGILEQKLFSLPLPRLRAALDAIEDLDLAILDLLRERGASEQLLSWESKLILRRLRREEFYAFRLSLEGAADATEFRRLIRFRRLFFQLTSAREIAAIPASREEARGSSFLHYPSYLIPG
jgi:hypothetical protein